MGLPFPSPGDLPNPGVETASPVYGSLESHLYFDVTIAGRHLPLFENPRVRLQSKMYPQI